MEPCFETRKITPPRLEPSHIGKKLICIRPGRGGVPRVELEERNEKIFVHNYGHGGGGWTLAPGSSKYAVDEFEKRYPHLAKDTPLAIVGGGIIGLFTAVHLVDKGYLKVTVYAEQFENLTSYFAGALFYPRFSTPLLSQWTLQSFKIYRDIVRKRHPTIHNGVRQLPLYVLSLLPDFEELVRHGMEPARAVKLDFGNGLLKSALSYDQALFVDVGVFLNTLRDQLANRLTFVQLKIEHLESLAEKYIFNCSGLGAKELSGDKEVIAVRGHLIFLRNQPSELNEYMFHGENINFLSPDGKEAIRSLYFFPKILPGGMNEDFGVLGGTYIEGSAEKTITPKDEEEFSLILSRAKEFFEKNESEVIKE